jgi:hypothetical protein
LLVITKYKASTVFNDAIIISIRPRVNGDGEAVVKPIKGSHSLISEEEKILLLKNLIINISGFLIVVLVLLPHSYCYHVSTGTGTQCWIWGSHSDDYEQCDLPSCNTMWFGDSPTFWRNIPLPLAWLMRKTNKAPKRSWQQSEPTFGWCLDYPST